MDWFRAAVSEQMVSPAATVSVNQRLTEVDEKLTELDVSALPVVDDGGLVGVISRTDLLRAGRIRIVTNGGRRHLLTLPDARVRDIMVRTVEVIALDAPLAKAARRMTRGHLHRLYVTENTRLVGVISTLEMMRTVAKAGVTRPIQEMMSSSIVMVKADDPLSLALERMTLAHHRSLVVVEDRWPVGMFSQVEALSARDAPPTEAVQQWMDARLLCLPIQIPAHHAAEQAIANNIRRVLAVDGEQIRGIVTGVDFARLVARGSEAQ